MIFMRYNGCPFKSEAVKVRRCLRWSSQTVIPYVLSCWVVFPVFAVWNFVSKQCRLPYTFVEVQWPCRRLLGIIDIWESAAPSCSFPHYNTRYRWWLLGCWCVQWAFKIIQHTSRENCLPQVEIHYTVLKTIPYIKGTKCGKEKCNTVLLFLILRGKTVYPAQSIPLY